MNNNIKITQNNKMDTYDFNNEQEVISFLTKIIKQFKISNCDKIKTTIPIDDNIVRIHGGKWYESMFNSAIGSKDIKDLLKKLDLYVNICAKEKSEHLKLTITELLNTEKVEAKLNEIKEDRENMLKELSQKIKEEIYS